MTITPALQVTSVPGWLSLLKRCCSLLSFIFSYSHYYLPNPSTSINNMSDFGRQSLGDKAGAALKPDSQKTTMEKAGDFVKGKADSAASTAQPESEKGFAQKAGDAVSGNQNQNSGGILDQAKHALGLDGNAAQGHTNTNTRL